MSKIAQFMKSLYDYEYEEPTVEEDYIEEEVEDKYDDYYEEPTPHIQSQESMTTNIEPTATVVMLSPYDIRTSQLVCEHIRNGHIVICNLTPSANNQRVVDYISGAVYTLQGRIEPTGIKTTFVCTPYNVQLVLDNPVEEPVTKVSAL